MDKYVKLAKIGQGSFGCAFLVAKRGEPDGKRFVVKEIRVDPRDQQSALREAKLLAALDHPNIIACKESFLLPPASAGARRERVLCIVTEFADGGDLRKAVQRRQAAGAAAPRLFQEHEVLDLFVQVCLALKHLHDRKIIHRDIKPDNIFLTAANVVKLGDFGVATVLSHTLASAETLTGTPYYTSPEICLGKCYNSKTDVWSLGCVLYELATLAHPFDGRSQRQLFDNITRASYTPLAAALAGQQAKTQYSAGLSALVDAMLQKNPRDRPSVSGLLRSPIVMTRIQRFLSDRAIADELSHTVLHGHDVFRKHAALPPPVVASPACLPPPAPLVAAKRAVATPTRAVGAPRSDGNAAKNVLKKPRPGLAPRPKAAALSRSRSLKKRGGALVGVRAAASPFRSPPSANKAAPTPHAARAKAPAPSPVAKKAAVCSKRQPRRAAPAAAPATKAAAGLPDPPPAPAAIVKPARGAVASRIAQFNAQAQRQELLDHLAVAPPPPPPRAAKQPSAAAKAYPKPVVIQVQGLSTGGTKKKAAVRGSGDGIRQHIRAKKQALARGASADPLDDPVILVQNLPDLVAETAASESLPSLHEDPPRQAPAPEPREADAMLQDRETAYADASESPQVHPWPAPPPVVADNLEFERMVLQLRSVVESASDHDQEDEDEASESDAEVAETTDALAQGDGDSPAYAATTGGVAGESPLALDVAVLEQDAFTQALRLAVACVGDAARTAEALAGLPPAHHRSLLWVRDYVAKIATTPSA